MRLSIQHLTLRMNTRVIVDDLSLDVDDGEIVGLVGESGSGKSMTATSVLGLAPRLGFGVSGSITLDGTELVGASDRRLRDIRGRRIAMIFQSPSGAFNPVMRVGEIFERTLRLHGAASNEVAVRAARSCEEVLLPALVLSRYPHQLSGGQLQRVAIALALALDAEVLLADEPTSALDVTVQAEVLTLLTALRDRGMAILLISHDLGVVAQVADRVAVMRAGKLVEVGPTRQVLDHPRDPYTQTLLAAVPRMAARPGDTHA